METGARFAKWGLGLFIFGVFLTFGIIAHYCIGARWSNGVLFMQNISRWWACPWTLSVASVQAGGLGMVALGLTLMVASRGLAGSLDGPSETALWLCIIGLLGVFAVGYPGYFVFDAIWPSFYYSPIAVGKNAWLLGQALFIGVYLAGAVLAFDAVRRALDTAFPAQYVDQGEVMIKRLALSTTALAVSTTIAFAQLSTVQPSPSWSRALPTGPDTRVKITDEYAKLVARDAYFWAWPLINIYNRRLVMADVKEPVRAGPLVFAPLNRNAMFTDYVDPEERAVACPNQDVVYDLASIALDVSPVVVQVPDFGDRFWVYQIVDLRSDSFVQLGKMYGTTPGFYLLVGPEWEGDVPKGITKVFRSTTNTGFAAPRVFQDDTPEDKKAIQSVLPFVLFYPLAEFDGTMKKIDWANLPKAPAQAEGAEESKWVFPEKFVDQLPTVLADAPPLPGEEARYAQVLAVLAAAQQDLKIKSVMTTAAAEADAALVKPLFQFRNYGQQLPHNWSTISNEAAFGTDYFTRTAVAKSNIFVNSPNETKYFYQDLDEAGARLNSANRYTVTFGKNQTPPVNGFWSLSIYNEHHFFVANPINRFSVGTKNKTLKPKDDGSLTIFVQPDEPSDPVQRANWLPPPKGDFSLYVRAYWPKPEVINGLWTPPAVKRLN